MFLEHWHKWNRISYSWCNSLWRLCVSSWTESSTSWGRRTQTWWPERRGSLWWSLLRWSEWEPRKPPSSTSQTSANCEPPSHLCSRWFSCLTKTKFKPCIKLTVLLFLWNRMNDGLMSSINWPFMFYLAGCIVNLNISLLSCWLSWEQGTSLYLQYIVHIGNICMRPKFVFLFHAFFFPPVNSGSIDGNNQLVIKGRFQQKQIENVLRRYISKWTVNRNHILIFWNFFCQINVLCTNSLFSTKRWPSDIIKSFLFGEINLIWNHTNWQHVLYNKTLQLHLKWQLLQCINTWLMSILNSYSSSCQFYLILIKIIFLNRLHLIRVGLLFIENRSLSFITTLARIYCSSLHRVSLSSAKT